MTKIEVYHGDITKIKIEAIINAANEKLICGGGLDAQVHCAAGPELQIECNLIGGCDKGDAKITKGYNLPAKHIIHVVGPVYGHEHGKEKEILASCYARALQIAHENNIKSIAFPAVGTGCFRFPKDEAAKIALNTVKQYINEHPEAFDNISFVLYTELDYDIYQALINTSC